MEQIYQALHKLVDLSEQEMCEVYSSLNSWQWHEKLGEPPKDFDELPRYNRKWYHKLLRRKTKYHYIAPIMDVICDIVGKKELLRYHHLYNLNSTNEEFEKWWNGEWISRAMSIYLCPTEFPNYGKEKDVRCKPREDDV